MLFRSSQFVREPGSNVGGINKQDPVVKLIFSIFPSYEKAVDEGGSNWVQSHGANALHSELKNKDQNWQQENLNKLLRSSIINK